MGNSGLTSLGQLLVFISFGNSLLKDYDYKKKCDQNSILIISQPYCTKVLVKITETLSAKFVNYNISFKCHPNDKLDDYEHLKNNFNNVKVIDNKNSNPYEVLSNNYIIIGQHSTMLFEATYFKEKIIFF